MAIVYKDKGLKPESGKFLAFDHVTFWVGNAKQTAAYYCVRFGFEEVGYRGLETGSRQISSHVVQQNKIFLVFSSMLEPDNPKEIGEFMSKHGDAVRDIAFEVEDLDAIYKRAVDNGAVVVREPWEEKDDQGHVRMVTIRTFGDITHTLIERSNYKGWFLPGYERKTFKDPLLSQLKPCGLQEIDHCVGNQPANEMAKVADWYERTLQFHRFWSADDKVIHTEFSALSSVIIANYEETIRMPINEPAPGNNFKSQTQEFVEYMGGAGIQHIAFHTDDIVETVTNLRARGVEFLYVPDTYYDELKERLKQCPIEFTDDIQKLRELNILVDFDERGYLLQIFTHLMQDRPTLYTEIIQRRNHCIGFGVGNFKSVFQAIERDQKSRGNL